MSPKKIVWGDIPNEKLVKDKDDNIEKWMECNVCCVVIRARVRTTFGFTEWENQCSSYQKVKGKQFSGNISKLSSNFLTTMSTNNGKISTTIKFYSNKSIKLVMPYPGLNYGENPVLLYLYK